MNKINWRNPKEELPKQGDIVWVMSQHWKEHGSLSCEIISGEVSYNSDGDCAVFNDDYIGCGGLMWTLRGETHGEVAVAWLPELELNLPDFIK